MQNIPCLRPGCEFTTGELEKDVALYQASLHEKLHDEDNKKLSNISSNQPERTEKFKKPTVTLGCTPEDWCYFEARWDDYK